MATIQDFNVEEIKNQSFLKRLALWFKAFGFLLFCLFIFVVAASATIFFSAISIIYTFLKYTLTLKWTTGMITFAKYTYQCALSIDQTGNVTCQEVFNDTMVKKKTNYHPFGEEDDTISYILAMNQKKDTLSKFGRFWAWFLNTVDKTGGGHMCKAIEHKKEKDLQAFDRVKENNYIC